MIPGAKDARELIAFYLDAGADALIGEEPVDRMAEMPPPERGRPPAIARGASAGGWSVF